MQQVTTSNFGLLIAYLIPGVIVLLAMEPTAKSLQVYASWNSISGLLISTILAVFIGMTCSALRWIIIDQLHHWTRIRAGTWEFGKLNKNLAAFEALAANQYQYYQFYSNSIVAGLVSYFVWTLRMPAQHILFHIGFWAWVALFWLASRDTLRKYYKRLDQLLS